MSTPSPHSGLPSSDAAHAGDSAANRTASGQALSAAQLNSLRNCCMKLAVISGAPTLAGLTSVEQMVPVLTSLVDICGKRLSSGQQTQHELREIREELEHVERLKAKFIQNVSHELRTPLASIDGFARALIRMESTGSTSSGELASPEMRKQFLAIISQEAQRLGKLIEDVLDLSDAEANRKRRNPTQFTARALLLEAAASQGTPQSPPKITLHARPEPDGPGVFADRENILEVLRQLLNNALKFSSGQEVVLGAESVSISPQRRPGTDSIPRDALTTATRFYVKDKGIGIPAEDLERIFEKFYRVDKAAHAFPGTGLGLAIVKALTTQNNGQVWAESELGVGSTFNIILPDQQ